MNSTHMVCLTAWLLHLLKDLINSENCCIQCIQWTGHSCPFGWATNWSIRKQKQLFFPASFQRCTVRHWFPKALSSSVELLLQFTRCCDWLLSTNVSMLARIAHSVQITSVRPTAHSFPFPSWRPVFTTTVDDNGGYIYNHLFFFFFFQLFQDTLFSKWLTNTSFWPILPMYKLQMLDQQLRGAR